MTTSPDATLAFPHPEPPAPGAAIEVAPGILWARIPLPFRLDHVNVYLIDDGEGWAVLDTGIANAAAREAWTALLEGPLAGRPLTRVVVSHYHPDHIGLAGWLCERHGVGLQTSLSAYLGCLNISLAPGGMDADALGGFYTSHGLDARTTAIVATQGHSYLKMVSPLPQTFERLVAGDRLRIGGRVFDVLSGDGHAPEQLMLHCAAEKLFLAADQVLAKITPNVSVWAVEPNGDPLGHYLRSLQALIDGVPSDVLVLPGHQLPFGGLHVRARELVAHHAERCALIEAACRAAPRSAAELVPVLFHRALDPHQMSFAFSETLAHVNYMLRKGELVWAEREGAVKRVVSAPD